MTESGAPPDTTGGGRPADSIRAHFASLATALDDNAHVAPRVRRWGEQLADIYARDGRLLACGHGGSAAEAQHLTGELVGRFRDERRPLSAIALHADTSAGTAIVNDYGAEQLYARQVVAHGRPGDVLMLFSTSGTSPAVVAPAQAPAPRGGGPRGGPPPPPQTGWGGWAPTPSPSTRPASPRCRKCIWCSSTRCATRSTRSWR
nr:SIS domain-containing protein [Nocardia wallacei]